MHTEANGELEAARQAFHFAESIFGGSPRAWRADPRQMREADGSEHWSFHGVGASERLVEEPLDFFVLKTAFDQEPRNFGNGFDPIIGRVYECQQTDGTG